MSQPSCALETLDPRRYHLARRMFGTQHLGIFLASGVLLNLTPGQDTFYIVGRSVAQGRRAGLLSVLGIVSGAITHTLAAAFGLSAILATSTHAFAVLRTMGAIYVAYLGVKLWLERGAQPGASIPRVEDNGWAIYRAGIVTNLLNPKVALFFLAFLPQFVAPTSDCQVASFLFLGGLFILTGTLWCLVLVWGASAMSRRLRDHASSATMLKRLAGTLFVVLGLRLLVSE
jgi:threonine/homoserine/homoserine lactone efflux protein